jgi:hypothetical protein
MQLLVIQTNDFNRDVEIGSSGGICSNTTKTFCKTNNQIVTCSVLHRQNLHVQFLAGDPPKQKANVDRAALPFCQ